jgi:hypothetical protein
MGIALVGTVIKANGNGIRHIACIEEDLRATGVWQWSIQRQHHRRVKMHVANTQ